MKLTAVDELILDIVGRDSPLVNGIGTEETWGDESSRQSVDDDGTSDMAG